MHAAAAEVDSPRLTNGLANGASADAAEESEHVQREGMGSPFRDVKNFWATESLPDDAAGPAGALVFKVRKGTNLVSADRNGLSDPYVIVKAHTCSSWRSKVCYKTLNPEWDQEHDFEGYLEDITKGPVKLRVYDFDVLSYNDPIGKCQVDISALTHYGVEHKLVFDDVPLIGVAHGTISFDVHFELKPVFALFPGTPVHASAAQALRRRPPADASKLELFRDGILRFLSRKLFLYIAVVWFMTLVTTIGFIVVLMIGQLIPDWTGKGTPVDPPREEAGWSREARLVGLSDDHLMHWSNVCFQVATGLFSYLNGIATPWRVSVLVHHFSSRSSAPTKDFYGRTTEAIWFHIPERPRLFIASCLCLSVFFHFASQATRLTWTTYHSSNTMPGVVPVNVTFGFSIVFGVAAGIMQGAQEKKLQKANPERYPPGLDSHLTDFIKRWRNGEIRLCSLRTFRELLRQSREEKAKWVIANELQRMKTVQRLNGSMSNVKAGMNNAAAAMGRKSKVAPEEPAKAQPLAP